MRNAIFSWFVLIWALHSAVDAAGDELVELSPSSQVGRFFQVTADLEVGGDLQVKPENSEEVEIQDLPLSVRATLEYVECSLTKAQPTVGEEEAPSIARYYHQARAVIKVDDGGHAPALPEDRRLLVVTSDARGETYFHAVGGRLNRSQLDLVNIIGNSLALDSLLPDKEVVNGDAWNNDEATLTALLGLNSIAVCEVQSILDKANEKYAQIRMAGAVHGTIDGTTTELDIRGIYIFDRRLRKVTHLNLAVKEKRSPGDVTPGLDVIAKLRLKMEPCQECEELNASIIADLRSGKQPLEVELQYDAPAQGLRISHDRKWFVTAEQREAVTLRRVAGNELVAHCTIKRLPARSAERPTTLDQFQKDIHFSLGKNFGEFVRSRVWTNRHNHRCFEVIVRGSVQEVPVEWHYYLLSSSDGQRASATFTVAGPLAEQLADADRTLVDALALVQPTDPNDVPSTAEIETEAKTSPHRSAPKTQRRSGHGRTSRRRQGAVRSRR